MAPCARLPTAVVRFLAETGGDLVRVAPSGPQGGPNLRSFADVDWDLSTDLVVLDVDNQTAEQTVRVFYGSGQ